MNSEQPVREMDATNLRSLRLAQTILLLKDLGVLLEILLDRLQEEDGYLL